ncbi:hypothetical protein HYC85_025211 [Camellia sinensis]|uniref:Uncharacterized protein n=1 Tax=Camellia sinensis TaxID=4442 RepID=A0A7J7GBN6_CAMSI|nr:hypothetical protein HYC85_025211 [Camellia sinensis]
MQTHPLLPKLTLSGNSHIHDHRNPHSSALLSHPHNTICFLWVSLKMVSIQETDGADLGRD